MPNAMMRSLKSEEYMLEAKPSCFWLLKHVACVAFNFARASDNPEGCGTVASGTLAPLRKTRGRGVTLCLACSLPAPNPNASANLWESCPKQLPDVFGVTRSPHESVAGMTRA